VAIIISRIVDISQQHTLNYFAFCGYNLTTNGGENMADTEFQLVKIGNRIAERRKQMGLTQEALAEKGDMTTQFVSYAEAGKRAMRPENLLKLSSALNVSADYLLTGEIVDKDLLILSDKMRSLTPSQLRIIENVIDECNKLYHND